MIKNKSIFLYVLAMCVFFFSGCNNEDIPAHTNSLVYKTDGRTVKLGNGFPIALDLSGDGQVDFTIFVEITANSNGDRLYVGINPIGENKIKSGLPIDSNFLNMGILVTETIDKTINFNLGTNQLWTGDHSALVIRNTSTNGAVTYEGNWQEARQIVGIQNNINGSTYFGWLRVEFDKTTEIVTLIDYAYNSTANQSIKAGAKSN